MKRINHNKKYIKLDKIWREIINKIPVTDNMDEFLLMKFLVTQQLKIPILKKHPLIYGWEFPLHPQKTNIGKIDLLFHDGRECFLIVETKHINNSIGRTARTRRNRARKEVVTQAEWKKDEFMRIYQKEYVECVSFTNETLEWEYKELNNIYRDFVKSEKEKVMEFYNFKGLMIYF